MVIRKMEFRVLTHGPAVPWHCGTRKGNPKHMCMHFMCVGCVWRMPEAWLPCCLSPPRALGDQKNGSLPWCWRTLRFRTTPSAMGWQALALVCSHLPPKIESGRSQCCFKLFKMKCDVKWSGKGLEKLKSLKMQCLGLPPQNVQRVCVR